MFNLKSGILLWWALFVVCVLLLINFVAHGPWFLAVLFGLGTAFAGYKVYGVYKAQTEVTPPPPAETTPATGDTASGTGSSDQGKKDKKDKEPKK